MADTAQVHELILGSASPRRSELLAQLGLVFRVETRAIDEAAIEVQAPTAIVAVARIARAKFAAFGHDVGPQGRTVLTADTLVSCEGKAMGKPESNERLGEMLRHMSGRDLEIVTAICAGHPGHDPTCATVTTTVVLRDLSADEISAYVATGVGMDKAGGLALQAEAGRFLRSVDGCWSNVLGLPLCAVVDVLGLAIPASFSCSSARCGSWR